jgi:branched-chain amino acid transport system substrate-binding protein
MTMHFDRLLKLGAACAAMLLLASCAGQGGGAAKPANPNEIVIGVAGPMTGDLAAFGEQLQRGARQAVADINAQGGVNGKPLRLVEGDDQCDPRKAVNVAASLVKQGVVFVAGHFCSGSSIPASEVYAGENILQITPSSTNPVLTDGAAAKGITTVLRTAGRDDYQGIFAGTWLAEHYKGKRLAVLDDGSAYGQSVARVTAQTAKEHGLASAMTRQYRARSRDFSELVAALKDGKADIVYIGGYHDDVAEIMREARAAGFTGDFAGADALNTSEFWTIAGSAGEGMRFTDAPSQINLPSARAVVAAFRSQGYEPEGYTLNTYAAVQAFAAAAKATGGADGKAMAAWLRANPVASVVGDLHWDAKGDRTDPSYAWFVWHNGRYAQEP